MARGFLRRAERKPHQSQLESTASPLADVHRLLVEPTHAPVRGDPATWPRRRETFAAAYACGKQAELSNALLRSPWMNGSPSPVPRGYASWNPAQQSAQPTTEENIWYRDSISALAFNQAAVDQGLKSSLNCRVGTQPMTPAKILR